MKRLLLVLAVAAGMLVLTPTASWACSCAISTTAQHVKRADTILDGILEWSATNGLTTTYSVKVAEVFKGRAAVREKVTSAANAATCGLGDLATDKRYLLFVHGEHPGTMQVDSCGGSALYDAVVAHRVEALTGADSKPLPERGQVVQAGNAGHHPPWKAGVFVLLGGAVIGGILLRRRRHTL